MPTTQSDLILRERLAQERTFLSIDRTILSYIRTSLTTAVLAITFLKLFGPPISYIGGFFFIIFSIIITVVGIRRSIQGHRRVKALTDNLSS